MADPSALFQKKICRLTVLFSLMVIFSLVLGIVLVNRFIFEDRIHLSLALLLLGSVFLSVQVLTVLLAKQLRHKD